MVYKNLRKSMVIMQIFGGLGNQMFQYATGRALACSFNTKLLLDLSAFSSENKYTPRSFGLDAFNIEANIATADDLAKFKQGRIKAQFERIRPWYARSVVHEPHYYFSADIFKGTGNAVYKGYWQSPKYFEHIQNEIKKEFTLKNGSELKNEGAEISEIENNNAQKKEDPQRMFEEEIRTIGSNSVSLHIRRGDYVTQKNVSEHMGVLPLEYYQAARAHMAERIQEPYFFVFSDDIEWARKNMFMENATYISRKGLKDYEEMMLMSMCAHNIVANSSFSWWGAWLNQNPHKIVIAPEHWFADSSMSTKDLIPEVWIQK